MKLKIKILLLVMAIFSISCASSNYSKIGNGSNTNFENKKDENVNISQYIENTSWSLADLAGTNVIAWNSVYITLNFKKDRIGGKSIINNYSAGYEINGKNIKISDIVCTEMGGPEELMQMESKYLELLENAKTIEIVNGDLVLKSDKGNLVFVKHQN